MSVLGKFWNNWVIEWLRVACKLTLVWEPLSNIDYFVNLNKSWRHGFRIVLTSWISLDVMDFARAQISNLAPLICKPRFAPICELWKQLCRFQVRNVVLWPVLVEAMLMHYTCVLTSRATAFRCYQATLRYVCILWIVERGAIVCASADAWEGFLASAFAEWFCFGPLACVVIFCNASLI